MMEGQSAAEEGAEFHITAVRTILTDEEIRRHWKTVFDIIMAPHPWARTQRAEPAEEKGRTGEARCIANDLTLEVGEDHLRLRRGSDAFTIHFSEIGHLIDALSCAATELLSDQAHGSLHTPGLTLVTIKHEPAPDLDSAEATEQAKGLPAYLAGTSDD